MMLRTRLTLGISLCFVAVTAIVALEGRLRLSEAEHRFERAEIAGNRNAWTGVASAELRGLRDELSALPNSDAIVQALADPARLAEGSAPDPQPFLADLLERIRLRLPGAHLEVVRADGSVVYLSHPGPVRFLSGSRLAAVLATTQGISGLVGSPTVVVGAGAPVFTRLGAAGAVALVTEAERLLPEVQANTAASVSLLSPAGLVLAQQDGSEGEGGANPGKGQPPSPWPGDVAQIIQAPDSGGLVRVSHAGRMIESTLLPLAAIDGERAAVLAVSRDITPAWRRAVVLSSLSYALVGAELALFLAGLFWYLRVSFRPLNAAIRVLNALSRGDTSVQGLPTTGQDEIGRLARTMEIFRRNQKLLAETSAAKERIDSELSVARDIQSHIVPTTFVFPGHPEFDLHAVMEPAKAVGGDLYDFFLLDERRLFFLIGDVSDKGVPAALFMAIAKALFKNEAIDREGTLAEVMGRVNRQLTLDNPSEMFVTVFACVLDLDTGIVTYADGGHELPVRLSPEGRVEVLKKQGGLALGFMADYLYTTAEIHLAPGDALLLYTDGVNEAMNPEHEMFKVERITETLQGNVAASGGAAQIARTLLGAVHGFAAGAPQSDDITILALRWKGPRALVGAGEQGREA
ncbi:PP2C family protein-serine/threonine phosphatase [Pararhodospirillum photometricum]|nr:SpoIIE family protein phosphatase [Pararhodospirillum photometricum]